MSTLQDIFFGTRERQLEILRLVTNFQWQLLYIASTEINIRIQEITFYSVRKECDLSLTPSGK